MQILDIPTHIFGLWVASLCRGLRIVSIRPATKRAPEFLKTYLRRADTAYMPVLLSDSTEAVTIVAVQNLLMQQSVVRQRCIKTPSQLLVLNSKPLTRLLAASGSGCAHAPGPSSRTLHGYLTNPTRKPKLPAASKPYPEA